LKNNLKKINFLGPSELLILFEKYKNDPSKVKNSEFKINGVNGFMDISFVKDILRPHRPNSMIWSNGE
jgi:hypothetical protein